MLKVTLDVVAKTLQSTEVYSEKAFWFDLCKHFPPEFIINIGLIFSKLLCAISIICGMKLQFSSQWMISWFVATSVFCCGAGRYFVVKHETKHDRNQPMLPSLYDIGVWEATGDTRVNLWNIKVVVRLLWSVTAISELNLKLQLPDTLHWINMC